MKRHYNRLLLLVMKLVTEREWTVLAITCVTLALSIALAARLELRSSLRELLPDNYQSVKELQRLLDRVGGVGTLIVAVEGPNVRVNKKFMDDLERELQSLPPGKIRQIISKADEIRNFYLDHALYYLDVDDVNLLYQRVKQRVDFEKIRKAPLFFDLKHQEDVPIRFDDIKERNEAKFAPPLATVGDYFGGEWGRMLIMMIRPYGASVTLESARALVATVEATVAGLHPESYGAPLTVGYCGNVKSTIEEYETLKHDVVSTALLCILFIALAISIFFLRLRIVFLLGTTLLVGISWTFALTKLTIGYLNAQTAFLGSIIIGTGINYGIILVARYLEERRKGETPRIAMATSLKTVVRPTFLAAATTAAAFIVLLLARIKGLSQFGIIGSMGVLCCWTASMLALPSMILVTERVWPLMRPGVWPVRPRALFTVLARGVERWPKAIITVAGIGMIGSFLLVWRFVPDAIEYDFTKLRNQSSVESGTEALERRVSKLFRHSMTPAVVLLDRPEDGPEVCRAVEAKNNALPEEERRVGTCHTVYDLLPTDQEEKIATMSRMADLLTDATLKKLQGETGDQIRRMRRSFLGRPLGIEDLPQGLARSFQDLEGHKGAVAFINPRPGMYLSDGRNLLRFADTIRDISLSDGRILHAAGESLIFSDLVAIIKSEAPMLTVVSFVAVIFFVFIMMRNARYTTVVVAGLCWGVAAMLGICAWWGLRINFFNFIVLPLTFGIGIDYGVNIAIRIQQDRGVDIGTALRHTGGAVLLCSVTTIIGYYVLTRATNQALAEFGLAAAIGEVTCIVAALVVVPALLVIFQRARKR